MRTVYLSLDFQGFCLRIVSDVSASASVAVRAPLPPPPASVEARPGAQAFKVVKFFVSKNPLLCQTRVAQVLTEYAWDAKGYTRVHALLFSLPMPWIQVWMSLQLIYYADFRSTVVQGGGAALPLCSRAA